MFFKNYDTPLMVARASGALVLFIGSIARAQDGAPEVTTGTVESSPAAQQNPTVDQCLDASEAAIQLENTQKLRSARDKWRVCAASSCPQPVSEECQKRLNVIQNALPSVLLEFRDTAGNTVSGVRFTLDGEPQPQWQPGTPVELDPGEHTITAEATGYQTLRHSLSVAARESRRPETLTLSREEPAPAVKTVGPGLHPRRVAALVLGGAAVLAAGVGGTFGIIAIQRNNEVEDKCGDRYCTNPADTERSRSAVAAADWSTGFFIGAGAAAAGAALLWLTAPTQESVQVGLGAGNVQLRGTF